MSTSGTAIRLVIVDDSPTVRAVLRRVLAQCPDLQVVAEAADGVEGVAAVVSQRPDLVLMDVQMPKMDGFGAIEQIMRHRPTPILVISSQVQRDELRTAFRALQAGALEVFPKPEGLDDWKAMLEQLPAIVRKLANAELAVSNSTRVQASFEMPSAAPGRGSRGQQPQLVAVGASAGGPAAIRELILGLGVPVPVGVVIAQHIVSGFEDGLAEWLCRETGADVRVARGGEPIPAHGIRIAPPGGHLQVGEDRHLLVDRRSAPRNGHQPSIDVLFESCAARLAAHSVGVLLSGMGRDGVDGMLAMRRQGAATFAQDRASCVVFGMPQAALAAGAAEREQEPREIGETVRRLLGGTA